MPGDSAPSGPELGQPRLHQEANLLGMHRGGEAPEPTVVLGLGAHLQLAPVAGDQEGDPDRAVEAVLEVARILDAAQQPALGDHQAQLAPGHPGHRLGQPLPEADRAAGEMPDPAAGLDGPAGEQHPLRSAHHHLDGEPGDAPVDLPELLLRERVVVGHAATIGGSRRRRWLDPYPRRISRTRAVSPRSSITASASRSRMAANPCCPVPTMRQRTPPARAQARSRAVSPITHTCSGR